VVRERLDGVLLNAMSAMKMLVPELNTKVVGCLDQFLDQSGHGA